MHVAQALSMGSMGHMLLSGGMGYACTCSAGCMCRL